MEIFLKVEIFLKERWKPNGFHYLKPDKALEHKQKGTFLYWVPVYFERGILISKSNYFFPCPVFRSQAIF